MSWKESIVWTALPNGMKDGKLRLTVMVAPRLQTDEVLAGRSTPVLQQFPHFLAWPATLGALKLSVFTSFPGLAQQPPKALEAAPDPASPAVDAGLWAKLFKPGSAVEAFAFKRLDDRLIHSFPARNVTAYLKQRYAKLAVASPTRLPSIESLVDRDLGFGQLADWRITGIAKGYESLKEEILGTELGGIKEQVGLREQAGIKEQAGLREQVGISQQGVSRRPVGALGQETAVGGVQADAADAGAPRAQTRSYDRTAKQRGVDPQRLIVEDVKVRARSHVMALFGSAKAIPPGPPKAVDDFMRVMHFHLPRSTKRLPMQIAKPQMDFHRMLTALGSHPELLRRLGLAIDLLVTVPPGGIQASGRIWVEATWPVPKPVPLPDSSPRTEYLYEPAKHPALAFQARPSSQDDDLDSRMLRLGGGEFDVIQVDTDGAAEKAMQLATNLVRTVTPELRTADSPVDTSLPSMQSAGITVARTGRAERMASRFVTAQANDGKLGGGQEVVLWAEDLVRGYRFDVFDTTAGTWQSLFRRAVTYDLLDGSPPIQVADEESWISSSVTSSTDEDEEGGKDLFLHEALVRWAGWSLAVPRPGKLLANDCHAGEFANLPESGFPLRVSTAPVKGSLPRLRFGRGYRVRARAVDLAGNSLSLADADAVATPPLLDVVATEKGFAYRRYEPLQQPILVLRNDLTGSPGEGIERLVIRSFNDAPPKDAVASAESSERHLAPAAVAQLTAELHGMFDGATGMRADLYGTIVDNEGSFAVPGSSQPRVYPEEQLQIPYLPDPIARGATLVGLPQKAAASNLVTVHRVAGAAATWQITPADASPVAVHQVEFGGSGWPDRLPFRLRVVGTIARRDPEWDAARRVLTVFLVPAEIARVRLSSYFAKEDLGLLAMWDGVRESGQAAALEKRALAGLHWMLTPSRELTLVHAVQQPLVTPEFKALASHRNVGNNFTILADQVPVDGRSTAKVDVLGEWEDPVDTGPAPVRVRGRAHAFEMKLDYGDTLAVFGPDRKVSFVPVTLAAKAAAVAAVADVPSADAAPAAPAGAPPAVRRVGTPAMAAQPAVRAVAPGRAQISAAAAAGIAHEIAARSYTVGKHEFGDTRYRRVTYTASAVSRFREYLPFTDTEIEEAEKSGGTKRITRRSQPRPLDVLSSARPAAPRVVYVVPTFGWTRSAAGGKLTSERRGGGLRVYLERPWFSSGDGELLAVVIGQPLRPSPPGSVTPPYFQESVKPYFTQWGLDPIWAGGSTPAALAPTLTTCRNPAATETDLTLDELDGARVSVAGYEVGRWDADGTLHGYDAVRGLWYCDIEIDPGEAYFPFIRLALARYQPHSLRWQTGDVKLSRVVVADFAQLAPDRTVSVATLSETELSVAVSGVGYRESAAEAHGGVMDLEPEGDQGPAGDQQQPSAAQRARVGAAARTSIPVSGGSSVEVSVETRPAGGGELGWVLVPDSTAVLQASAGLGMRRTWSGKVTLPAPRGSKPFRLVIRESEWFIVDGPSVVTGSAVLRQAARRLVFAETLEV